MTRNSMMSIDSIVGTRYTEELFARTCHCEVRSVGGRERLVRGERDEPAVVCAAVILLQVQDFHLKRLEVQTGYVVLVRSSGRLFFERGNLLPLAIEVHPIPLAVIGSIHLEESAGETSCVADGFS